MLGAWLSIFILASRIMTVDGQSVSHDRFEE